MTTYGITEGGFVRKPLTQIYDDLVVKAQDAIGSNLTLGDDNYTNHVITTIADELDQLWQGLEGVYTAQTRNGAEGYDLDELLSRQGVYRQGKRNGSGTIHLITSDTLPNNSALPLTTNYNSGSYIYNTPIQPQVTTNNVWSYTMLANDITLGVNYDITVMNTSSQTLVTSSSYTPNTVAEVGTMFQDFVNFIYTNKPELINYVHYVENNASDDFAFLMGYTAITLAGTTTYSLTALPEQIYFFMTNKKGKRGTNFNVVAKDAGRQVVTGGGGYSVVMDSSTTEISLDKSQPSTSITKVSPSFSGFVDVFSINNFNSGAEQETDAEYIFRYNQIIDKVTASTRDAVEGAILGLDDVQKVRIYENLNSVDTVEADAYTFNTVFLGGSIFDIAQTIYDKKPINVDTSGTNSVVLSTLQGDAVTIRLSPASEVDLNVRITYKTKTSTPLNSQEQRDIGAILEDYTGSIDIGDDVINEQLKSYIFPTLGFGRLTSLTVEVKRKSDPISAYSSSDFIVAYNESANISASDIAFVSL